MLSSISEVNCDLLTPLPPNLCIVATIRFKSITGDGSDNINKNWKNSTTRKGKERILGNCTRKVMFMLQVKSNLRPICFQTSSVCFNVHVGQFDFLFCFVFVANKNYIFGTLHM